MRVALIFLACLAACRQCAGKDDLDKLLGESNASIQKQIREISRVLHPVDGLSRNGEAFRKMPKLKESAKDEVELVKQVAIFSMAAGEETQPMTAGAILHYLEIPSGPTIRALAPYLYSRNPQLESFVLDWFHAHDNWGGGGEWEAVNFKDYLDYVSSATARDENIPLPFIKYIFERSPGHALRVFAVANSHGDVKARLNLIRKGIEARQKGTEPPLEEAKRMAGERQSRLKERSEIELAEHIVSNAIWLKKHGFQYRFQQALPEAKEELKKLARRPEWWARLYVVYILRQQPELGRGELLEQLKKDDEELVRDALTTRE